jgi:hypothetical protein
MCVLKQSGFCCVTCLELWWSCGYVCRHFKVLRGCSYCNLTRCIKRVIKCRLHHITSPIRCCSKYSTLFCKVAKKLEVAEVPDVASGSCLDVFPIERKLKCNMCWHLLQGLQRVCGDYDNFLIWMLFQILTLSYYKVCSVYVATRLKCWHRWAWYPVKSTENLKVITMGTQISTWN